MAEELWAVHVEGPDDVLAMRSRTDAETHAQLINDMYEKFRNRPDHSELDGRWHAVVVPWPYDAVGHAESLADQETDHGC